MAQGRHRHRAHRPRTPRSKWEARALPPHPQAGNLVPARRQPSTAAAPLRCLLPRLQPQPPPRGARAETPGQPLATLAAALSRQARRALVRRKPRPPPRPQQRRDQVGRRQHLHQRDPRRREPWHRRNQRRRLARSLCRDRSRHHRHKKTTPDPIPTAKRRTKAREQSKKTVTYVTGPICHPSNRLHRLGAVWRASALQRLFYPTMLLSWRLATASMARSGEVVSSSASS